MSDITHTHIHFLEEPVVYCNVKLKDESMLSVWH